MELNPAGDLRRDFFVNKTLNRPSIALNSRVGKYPQLVEKINHIFRGEE